MVRAVTKRAIQELVANQLHVDLPSVSDGQLFRSEGRPSQGEKLTCRLSVTADLDIVRRDPLRVQADLPRMRANRE